MFSILYQAPQNYLLQPFLITIKTSDFSVVGIENIGICEIIIPRKITMCDISHLTNVAKFTSSFDFSGSVADL